MHANDTISVHLYPIYKPVYADVRLIIPGLTRETSQGVGTVLGRAAVTQATVSVETAWFRTEMGLNLK